MGTNINIQVQEEGKMSEELRNAPVLYIVVPCYNEEEMLPISCPIFTKTIEKLIASEKIAKDSQVLFVDDGSKDSTWKLLFQYSADKNISAIKLSHNAGHQNALFAGLTTAMKMGADITVTIDADLQDDINAIEEMIDKYNSGSDIVYGVRSSRKKDSFFKRVTAEAYYKILKHLGGTETIYNHADYRLMSAKAVRALLEYKESNLYLRGLVTKLGFKTDKVFYERKEREKGESKYPLSKMIGLALNGITAMSAKLLSFVFVLSVIFVLAAVCAFIAECVMRILTLENFLVPLMLLSTGVVLFALSIHGLYIGRTYIEVKRRPRFNIEEEICHAEC